MKYNPSEYKTVFKTTRNKIKTKKLKNYGSDILYVLFSSISKSQNHCVHAIASMLKFSSLFNSDVRHVMIAGLLYVAMGIQSQKSLVVVGTLQTCSEHPHIFTCTLGYVVCNNDNVMVVHYIVH